MKFLSMSSLLEIYEQLLMRGVPKPLLAFAIALLAICSCIGLIVGVVVAAIGLFLLAQDSMLAFFALMILLCILFLAKTIYKDLPDDPRKSKTKE